MYIRSWTAKATSSTIAVDQDFERQEYIVNSGLTPGDVIVAEGVGLLREARPLSSRGRAPQHIRRPEPLNPKPKRRNRP